MKSVLSFLVFVLVMSVSSAVTAQELTLISQNTVRGKTTTGTQYLGAKKMRIDDGAGSDMIFDYETGTLTLIEHKKKRYWQASVEDMRAQMADLAKTLENVPGADRLLGAVGNIQVDETGESQEIAGYRCDKIVMTIGESFSNEMCVARDLKPPISYFDARKAMTAMLGPMAKRFETMFEEMSKINGMALETITRAKMLGQSMDSTSTVSEVKLGPLPADAFDIPADYKKKKSPYE